MSAQTILQLLRENPVFRNANPSCLNKLLEGGSILSFPADKIIFNEGNAAAYLYVLSHGAVRVFHHHESGRQLTVKHLSPPTTFGEMEILSGEPYLESVETICDSTLVQLDAHKFKCFIDDELTSANILLKDICARFCVAARNECAPFFEVPVRLASLLLSYADLFGRAQQANSSSCFCGY